MNQPKHTPLRRNRHRSAADYEKFASALGEDIFDGAAEESQVSALGRVDDRVLKARQDALRTECTKHGIKPSDLDRI